MCPTEVDLQVVLDNGIVQVTLSKPQGSITGVKYLGVDNVMEVIDKEDSRGYANIYLQLIFFDPSNAYRSYHPLVMGRYWDLVWNPSDRDSGIYQK